MDAAPTSTTGSPTKSADLSITELQKAVTVSEKTVAIPEESKSKKSARFWLVFLSLCLASFAANLNATILSTLLPTITRELHGETKYVWVSAAYNIAATAIQPLCGQISNIFGRRTPMLTALVLFVLGSGVCGGANGMGMLIAGRAVQGLGAGGIMMLLEVITCDLMPLRERSKYLSLILAVNAIAITVAPTIGGAFATKSTWRWAFYISLPAGGIAFVLSFFFLVLKFPREPTWKAALLRVDFLGNVIFISATCSMMIGLVMGGQIFSWSSFRIILPIVLGVLGWALFLVHQNSSICKEPTMPLRLFSNRTACVGFLLVFLSCMLLEWIVYFLPYYFQSLKGTTQLRSGINTLPFNIFFMPAAGTAGGMLYKFGQYKPIHWIGFGCLVLGGGLFSTMDTTTSTVKWVFWEFFAALGLGSLMTTTLPAIQSSLPESDVAVSTGTHAFLRTYGMVWGFVIPSIIFNDRINSNINMVQDAGVRDAIMSGAAYSQINTSLFTSLPDQIKAQVLQLYKLALQNIWYAAAAFAAVGFLAVFVEKRIELRTELETQFGLAEEKGKEDDTEKA